MPSDRIIQQIEETADYHAPGVYDLLSKYGHFETVDDEAAAEFVPLSPTALSSRNPKPFVIGILPPTANVSDRKIDRSASVLAQTGSFASTAGKATPTEEGPERAGKPTSPVDEFVSPDATAATIPEGKGGLQNGSYKGRGAKLTDQFWIDFNETADRLHLQPEALASVMHNESGFNTSAVAVRDGKVTARGLFQLSPTNARNLGMSQEEYDRFGELSAERQLFWAEKFYKNSGVRNMTAAQLAARNLGDAYAKTNPNGVLYARLDYQAAHGGTAAFKDSAKQDRCYKANEIVDKDGDGAISREDVEKWISTGSPFNNQIARARDARRLGAKSTREKSGKVGADGTAGAWQKGGSKDAKVAAKDISKTAGTNLNATPLGQSFQAAQEAIRKATQAALQQIATTPPLRLIVNPESFSFSAEKIVSDGNYGRNGPIVEHWGNSQERIEGSGRIAAFYALDAFNASTPGLTRTARAGSQSFQNLMSLYLLYKSNGALWLKEFADNRVDNPTLISVVGSIYIFYDNILYIGSFDNFTITENDTTPFSLEYSFTFVVRAWFLLDSTEQQLLESARNLRSKNALRTVSPFEGPNARDIVAPPFSSDPVVTDVISRAQDIFTRNQGT